MARKALLGRLSNIDIRLLRVFDAVVKSGGFAAAEMELNIGRSTISRHVSDLEGRLGMRLCDRGAAGFFLTKEGEQVLEAATRLFSAIDVFQDDIEFVHETLTGQLKVALFDHTATNPEAKVSKAFNDFDNIAPEVELNVVIEPTNVIETGIIDRQYDIGIIPIHRSSASLAYQHLYTEQMYLYCGHNHPLFEVADNETRPRDVRSCKYAGLSFHSPNLVIGNKMRLDRVADVNDQEALAILILSGRYIGFLPDHFAASFVNRNMMKAIGAKKFRYNSNFAAIYRRHPAPSRKAETFLDCLRAAHRMG